MVLGRSTAFSNNKKMVTILHKELECKNEKVKHIKLEVMRLKTKSNMNRPCHGFRRHLDE